MNILNKAANIVRRGVKDIVMVAETIAENNCTTKVEVVKATRDVAVCVASNIHETTKEVASNIHETTKEVASNIHETTAKVVDEVINLAKATMRTENSKKTTGLIITGTGVGLALASVSIGVAVYFSSKYVDNV